MVRFVATISPNRTPAFDQVLPFANNCYLQFEIRLVALSAYLD
jgi:hypothetical protein